MEKWAKESVRDTFCSFLDEERKTSGGSGCGECIVDLVVILRTAEQEDVLMSTHQRFSNSMKGSYIENT